MKQTFGIELEFASSHTQGYISNKLNELFQTMYKDNTVMLKKHSVDVDNHGYHEHNVTKWGIEYDSSIETSAKFRNQIEVVSPILTLHDLPAIKAALTIFKPSSMINRSCGFHVHVGIETEAHANRCYALWHASEDEIVQIFPLARSQNSYCRRLNNGGGGVCFSIDNITRHDMLNIQSFRVRKTVEFRGHSATLNYNKIKKWILFCLSFVRLAEKVEEQRIMAFINGPYCHSAFPIFDELDIATTKTKRYFDYRKAHFERGKQRRLKREQLSLTNNRRGSY